MRVNKILYWLYFSGLGLALLYLAINKGLTGDETGTVAIVNNLTYMEIFQEKYLGDFNPFGFYLLNKIFVYIFGENHEVYKAIPVLFYTLSIVLMYKVAYILSNDKEFSLINAVVFSLLPLNLFYALFDRPYSLLSLVSLSLLYLTLSLYKDNNNRTKFFYVITLSVGMYFHFFVGLFTATLFFVGLFFKELRDKKFMTTIFILNITALILFIPELLSFMSKASDVTSIVQEHAKLGYIYKLAFVSYGVLFGMTLAPVSQILILIIAIVMVGLALSVYVNKDMCTDKVNLFSLLFIAISLCLISLTGFARPMYVIFVTPFVSFIIVKLLYQNKIKLFTYLLLGIFVFANYNFIASNSKYFIIPHDTIDYKYYYGDFLASKIDGNTLVVIAPSYNKINFEIYSNYQLNKVLFINPFIDIQEQLTFNESKYSKILVFQEFQNNDIFKDMNKKLNKFISSDLVDKKHRSFIKNTQYSYFKIVEYKR